MTMHLQWLALPPAVIVARYLGYISKVAVEEFFSERKLRMMLDARDRIDMTYSKGKILIQCYSLPNEAIAPADGATRVCENACCALGPADSFGDEKREATVSAGRHIRTDGVKTP